MREAWLSRLSRRTRAAMTSILSPANWKSKTQLSEYRLFPGNIFIAVFGSVGIAFGTELEFVRQKNLFVINQKIHCTCELFNGIDISLARSSARTSIFWRMCCRTCWGLIWAFDILVNSSE